MGSESLSDQRTLLEPSIPCQGAINFLGHKTVSQTSVLALVRQMWKNSTQRVWSTCCLQKTAGRRAATGLIFGCWFSARCSAPGRGVSLHAATGCWSVKGELRWATSRCSNTSKFVLSPGWSEVTAPCLPLLVRSLIRCLFHSFNK